MKRLLAALLTSTAALAASAHTRQLVDVTVIDRDTGLEAPIYHDGGQTYLAGEPGHRYAVRLNNQTGERVLVVLSIDGVNAVSGETAGANQAGYVLSPYEQAEINGWRKSLRDVAQFVFSAPESSYASRTGRPDNVGVIGVAVFQEQMAYVPRPRPQYPIGRWDDRRKSYEEAPYAERDGAAPAPAAPATGGARAESGDGVAKNRSLADGYGNNEAPDLGTAHGQREWAPVGTTEFRRRSNRPAEVISMQYRSYEFLVDQGIAPPCRGNRWNCEPRRPEAFPLGFVPDPY
ncbi:hypothetical protein C7S18_10785 [Ahniella affigens]|uniref:Uncharacterized protein n=1 Tax=Ahniella affigens TaxID=2021234 RepID=A0A2P1PS53_9GAMM|nr:hypothetical protein [Ahniella affigens]AVP97655.1 hypothetical protein C7S18_10785 [Ahniella affigens]